MCEEKHNNVMSDDISKLAEALSLAQGELTGAVKDAENPFFKKGYASLTSVWESCRSALSKNGLSVIQTTTLGINGSKAIVITTLAHKSGQWIRGTLGIKPIKDDPQQDRIVISYFPAMVIRLLNTSLCFPGVSVTRFLPRVFMFFFTCGNGIQNEKTINLIPHSDAYDTIFSKSLRFDSMLSGLSGLSGLSEVVQCTIGSNRNCTALGLIVSHKYISCFRRSSKLGGPGLLSTSHSLLIVKLKICLYLLNSSLFFSLAFIHFE